ncbi:MAG: hypothetical protein HY854_23310 [Burkholderiales bacterium]|nr:hypothetical protein [Burkholderiales bacterium]
MHGAPSVSYPVARCRFALAVAALLWALGAGALAAWARQSAVAPSLLAAAVGVWAAAGALAAVSWLRSPAGELRWTGSEWTFRGVPAGAPEVAVDLQRWLLVRLAGGGRHAWLWLERGQGADWDALRRAVYSRASAKVPPGPVASP